MSQCKTCGENKFIWFCSSECESYSGNKTVVKNEKGYIYIFTVYL